MNCPDLTNFAGKGSVAGERLTPPAMGEDNGAAAGIRRCPGELLLVLGRWCLRAGAIRMLRYQWGEWSHWALGELLTMPWVVVGLPTRSC
jgi:hypothetical protein